MLREKIQTALLKAKIKLSLAISDFKKDESAMEVIQVVMLVLVGVLAIVAVWAGVSGLLEDLWGQITGNTTLESGPSL